MRPIIFLSMLAALIIGCGHSASPVLPSGNADASGLTGQAGSIYGDQYCLWSEGEIFIAETHDRVDVVPRRNSRVHLNALKFLEEYCTDCLKITNIHNNGDSTIDLTVQIKHPFKGFPQYTGFDVKGILMFDGSWTNEGHFYYPPWPDPFRVSWRGLGDPQVLNADGYTLRWSPSYDSGSTQPIFNYYEGKYANGTPTANLNAYKNFYTHENRHMFITDGIVTKTYTIWLPPGEAVTAGYAVEACWEPPLKMPVTDPINDFPSTANQPEAYEFKIVLNSGEVITDPDCCNSPIHPSKCHAVSKQWGGHTALAVAIFSEFYSQLGAVWPVCDDEWPELYCGVFYPQNFPDGDHIGVGINFKGVVNYPPYGTEMAYTVFEFTIDFE